MSDHDPFDGIYSSASVHAEPVGDAEPEQEIVSAEDGGPSQVETVYSSAFLRRQSKGDLQKIAHSKGLDDTGTREEMIDLIEDHQNK